MKRIKPIEDLRWYHQESPSALGQRGIDYEGMANAARVPVVAGPAPEQRVLAAARRQQGIQDALRRISKRHRTALELAYADPPAAAWARKITKGDDGKAVESLEYQIADAVLARMAAELATSMVGAVADVARWEAIRKALASGDGDQALKAVHGELLRTHPEMSQSALDDDSPPQPMVGGGSKSVAKQVSAALSSARVNVRLLKERRDSLAAEAIELVGAAHDAYVIADRSVRDERRQSKAKRAEATASEARGLASELKTNQSPLMRTVVALLSKVRNG